MSKTIGLKYFKHLNFSIRVVSGTIFDFEFSIQTAPKNKNELIQAMIRAKSKRNFSSICDLDLGRAAEEFPSNQDQISSDPMLGLNSKVYFLWDGHNQKKNPIFDRTKSFYVFGYKRFAPHSSGLFLNNLPRMGPRNGMKDLPATKVKNSCISEKSV